MLIDVVIANSLNPYFVGRWFLRCVHVLLQKIFLQSLNPYFVGRWFLRISGSNPEGGR